MEEGQISIDGVEVGPYFSVPQVRQARARLSGYPFQFHSARIRTAGFLGRALIRLGERLVARMPFVRGIYSASKQIIETVVGQKETSFREVVLMEFPRKGVWTIGFITGVTKGEIQRLVEDECVNVFVPTTPNPTGGYLMFVPRRELIPLEMSVEDGIKLVVSCGIVIPADPRAIGGDATHAAPARILS